MIKFRIPTGLIVMLAGALCALLVMTYVTIVNYYDAGFDWRRIVIEHMDWAGADFRGISLAGANLEGANLEGTGYVKDEGLMPIPATSLAWAEAYQAWARDNSTAEWWYNNWDEVDYLEDLTAFDRMMAGAVIANPRRTSVAQSEGFMFLLIQGNTKGFRKYAEVVVWYAWNDEAGEWVRSSTEVNYPNLEPPEEAATPAE